MVTGKKVLRLDLIVINGDLFHIGNSTFLTIIGSSHRRCSIKKDALKNFGKIAGKHLYQSLFFNQVAEHLFYRTPPGARKYVQS